MLLELQIQIRVSESARAPMLLGHDLARQGLESAPNLATPRAEFKGLALPGCPLDRCDVFPALVVAGTVAVMQRIEYAQLCLARGIQDLNHVRDALVGFSHAL